MKPENRHIYSLPAVRLLGNNSDPISNYYPFNSEDASCWHSARVAIWQALERLAISENDKIAMPAYSCGSELDPFIKKKLSIVFYKIKENLSVDLEHVESIIDKKTRYLYVTHYLGFPQDMNSILSFCRKHDLILLEDVAHALFSEYKGRPCGSLGHMAFFSLTKSLPLTDGGILIDRLTKKHAYMPEKPDQVKILGKLKYRVEERISISHYRLSSGIHKYITNPATGLYKSFKENVNEIKSTDSTSSNQMGIISLQQNRVNWSISSIAQYLLKLQKPAFIKQKRRENFSLLLDAISADEEVMPVFHDLPEGVCPLLFPIIVKEPKALNDYLIANRIYGKRLWSYFHDQVDLTNFKFEKYLKTHIIGLPIHHELNREEMEYIGKVLKNWRVIKKS